jgi:hypothetical protein
MNAKKQTKTKTKMEKKKRKYGVYGKTRITGKKIESNS